MYVNGAISVLLKVLHYFFLFYRFAGQPVAAVNKPMIILLKQFPSETRKQAILVHVASE